MAERLWSNGLPLGAVFVLSVEVVGRNVKALRESAELTQAQLADRLKDLGWDIDSTAITRIEKGNRSLRVPHMHLIAEALECYVGDLLDPPMDAISDLRTEAHRGILSARRSLAKALGAAEQVYQMAVGSQLIAQSGLPGVEPETYLAYVLSKVRAFAAAEKLETVAIPVRHDEMAVELQEIADGVVADIVRFYDRDGRIVPASRVNGSA